MTTVFVSHASVDDAWASGLENWLIGNGFPDLFVDHTNRSGITAGERWKRALQKAIGRTRAAVYIVTESWLASDICFVEYMNALLSSHGIVKIALILLSGDETLTDVAKKRLDTVQSDEQNLFPGAPSGGGRGGGFFLSEDCAAKLQRGLRDAGALVGVALDPNSFKQNETLLPTPFPGLDSFGDNDGDAAIFFGRARETAATLEKLRKIRDDPKSPVAILGASGTGKSSLLKAGVIPRLRREAPHWIVLRAFRPGNDPLLEFAGAIALTAAADFSRNGISSGNIHSRLHEAWKTASEGSGLNGNGEPKAPIDLSILRDALDDLAREIREWAGRPDAPILMSIDQAEELMRANVESASALADYLRAATLSGSAWRIALSIRTDSFAEIQRHPRFSNLEMSSIDLRALPHYRFLEVIERPAALYRVNLAPELVDALIEDAAAQSGDALPLLAFALQRLWDQHAPARKISLENYRDMGGLARLLADASNRALAGQSPKDIREPAAEVQVAQLEIGARIFVPALAEVNEEGEPIRRVASWGAFGPEAQSVLDRFVAWRLLIKRGEDEDATVEVAHEALFRVWPLLAGWLERERENMEGLRGLEQAAQEWDRHKRASAFLVHSDERLSTAEALRHQPTYWSLASSCARDYLEACRGRTDEDERRRQDQQRQNEIQKQRLFAATAVNLLREGRADGAMRVALAGGLDRDSIRLGVQESPERYAALAQAAHSSRLSCQCAAHPKPIPCLAWHPKGEWIVTGAHDGIVRIVDPLTGAIIRASPFVHTGWVNGVCVTSDGAFVISGGRDGKLLIWDVEQNVLAAQSSHVSERNDQIRCVDVGSRWIAAGCTSGNAFLWSTRDLTHGRSARARPLYRANRPEKTAVLDVKFNAAGDRLALACEDGSFSIWRLFPRKLLWRMSEAHERAIWGVALSPDGNRIATASYDKRASVWDLRYRRPLFQLGVHNAEVRSIAFDRQGLRIATASFDFGVRVFDAFTGRQMLHLGGHDGAVQCVAFDNLTGQLASASYDRTVRTWGAVASNAAAILRPNKMQRWLSVALSPVNGVIALAGVEGGVELFEAAGGGPVRRLASAGARRVQFSADGARLMASTTDGRAIVYDTANFQPIAEARSHCPDLDDEGSGDCTAMDNGGTCLATFVAETGVTLTDLVDSTLGSARWTVALGDVVDVAVSPYGSCVAALDRSSHVHVIRDGAIVETWPTGFTKARRLCFVPTGESLVAAGEIASDVGGAKNEVRRFTLSGDVQGVFQGHGDFIWDMSFSTDGERVATACRDRRVRLFDVTTSALVAEIALDEWVRGVALSPLGEVVAAAGENGLTYVGECVFGAGLTGTHLELAVARARLIGAAEITRDEAAKMSAFAMPGGDEWHDLSAAVGLRNGGGAAEAIVSGRLENWRDLRGHAMRVENEDLRRRKK